MAKDRRWNSIIVPTKTTLTGNHVFETSSGSEHDSLALPVNSISGSKYRARLISVAPSNPPYLAHRLPLTRITRSLRRADEETRRDESANVSINFTPAECDRDRLREPREMFSPVPIRFQGRLLMTEVPNSAMFRPGDEGLTPELLSASARIVEREVRGVHSSKG